MLFSPEDLPRKSFGDVSLALLRFACGHKTKGEKDGLDRLSRAASTVVATNEVGVAKPGGCCVGLGNIVR